MFWVIFFINAVVIGVVILFHYEMLTLLNNSLPRTNNNTPSSFSARLTILVAVFGVMIAHVIEIWFFGLVYYALLHAGDFGDLVGDVTGTVLDCVYFSFVSYTSLGVGDIYAVGLLRFLTGLEALTGLVLITWSASFLFLKMQKFWNE